MFFHTQRNIDILIKITFLQPQGFDNPALNIEPHYAPESDRHYFNRHTKSNFTPLLDTDDAIPPPPKYDFSEGDHPHPRTIQAMNASKGPLGRHYLTPGTTPFGSSGTDSGSSSPALKRHHKVKPVEEDAQSNHSPQDLGSRCNTPDLFTARSGETPSRSATPAFGKHNKISPDNGKDSPNGSHHSDSNHKGSQRSSPQSLEMTKPTELTFSDMDCDTEHSEQSSVWFVNTSLIGNPPNWTTTNYLASFFCLYTLLFPSDFTEVIYTCISVIYFYLILFYLRSWSVHWSKKAFAQYVFFF